MPDLELVILAIVQGIAEFLPISSSGHLVLVGQIFEHQEESATLNIVLHAGTLGSILVVYWRRIWRLLFADRRVIPILAVGTIPAVIAGGIIKVYFEPLLANPLLTAAMLLVTGGMLLMLPRMKPGATNYSQLTFRAALLIGCYQAFAILPGISRSGATIVGGRFVGLRQEDAVTFSFLLAIPAIAGATLLEALSLIKEGAEFDRMAPLITAAGLSFGVGVLALIWLVRWSRSGKLHLFAWWCFAVGILTLGLALSGQFASAPPDSVSRPEPTVSIDPALQGGINAAQIGGRDSTF